jgi:clan AA aspartic protease (TIGR02281 family)
MKLYIFKTGRINFQIFVTISISKSNQFIFLYMESSKKKCKYCLTEIPADKIYENMAFCVYCSMENVYPKKPYRITLAIKIAIGLFIFLMPVYFFFDDIGIVYFPEAVVGHLDKNQLIDLANRCTLNRRNHCLVSVFKKLNELEPLSLHYKANWAFSLTRESKFNEASPIYAELLKSGFGAYDLMSFYAMNFEGLGKTAEAIKWYEKSLGVFPAQVDTTRSLARLYVKEKRPLEAISLLKSFMNTWPESEGYLLGDLVASLDLIDKSTFQKSIKLVGVQNGQFGLPIMIKENPKPIVFLIDTGASAVTLPTKDVEEYMPELIKKSQQVVVQFADGRKALIQKIVIPKLTVGLWEFQNIEAVYCDQCARLAGMSLLKSLRLHTTSEGNLSVMTVSKSY